MNLLSSGYCFCLACPSHFNNSGTTRSNQILSAPAYSQWSLYLKRRFLSYRKWPLSESRVKANILTLHNVQNDLSQSCLSHQMMKLYCRKYDRKWPPSASKTARKANFTIYIRRYIFSVSEFSAFWQIVSVCRKIMKLRHVSACPKSKKV